MSRSDQELVAFGSTFDRSGFGVVGAQGYRIGGEGQEQILETVSGLMDRGCEQRSKGEQGADGALEGETGGLHIVLAGRFEHEEAHEVVGDGLHRDFFLDHGRGLGAKHIQTQGGLDVPEVELHLPTQTEQLGDGRMGYFASESGVYQVLNRGNYRTDIFRSAKAKGAFLTCLGEACAKTGWVVHAWCVMSNHYHLAVSAPGASLARVRWLQGTFSTRFNRLRNERGHLFQGRYKSLLVDPDGGLGPLCHYIHLNPVRAKLRPISDLPAYP